MVVSDNGKTFKPAAREITRILNDPGVKEHLRGVFFSGKCSKANSNDFNCEKLNILSFILRDVRTQLSAVTQRAP